MRIKQGGIGGISVKVKRRANLFKRKEYYGVIAELSAKQKSTDTY